MWTIVAIDGKLILVINFAEECLLIVAEFFSIGHLVTSFNLNQETAITQGST
jgi:hypothetical protein